MEAPCKKLAKRVKWTPHYSSTCFITNLPTPILMDILCRLPIKTLTATKSVCKSWLRLFRDPEFSQLHQAIAPTEVCFQLFHEQYSVDLHMLNLHKCDPLDDVKLNTLLAFPKFSVRPNNDLNVKAVKGHFHFANSCNGLLCYYGGTNRFAVVWNPCTSQLITFPAPNVPYGSPACRGYGLGFSRKANKYKLLRVYGQICRGSSAENVEAEICTIEEDCYWKKLGPCPSDVWQALGYCTYNDPFHGIFLHDALHWLLDSGSAISIITFDFENYQFGRAPLPRSFVKTKWNTYSSCRVGVLGGCLFITDYTSEGVNIWLMKEYGVQDSWTKTFCVGYTIRSWMDHKRYLPITYMDNGEILMTCTASSSTNVFFYNPVLKSVRGIGSGSYYFRVIAYRPNLVPLEDSMLGYNCAKAVSLDLEQRKMYTAPNWWSPVKKAPQQQGTQAEEERKGHVSAISECSVSESSVGMSAQQQGTMGGESHGLIQISTSVMSAQETSAAELACPLITNEICVSATMEDPMKTPQQQGTQVEEEREGYVNAISECSVSESSVGMSAQPGTTGGESHGLIQMSTSVMSLQETSADELARPLITNEICVSATMEDPMKTLIVEVMEKKSKEQELEERLRNDFAEVEPLQEQIQQLKQQNQKQIQESEQLKQKNRELEERLEIEQAKVEHLKEQIQQSEQLKQESKQMTIQMMEEMMAHIMGSH